VGHVSPPIVRVKYVGKDATVPTYRLQRRKRGHGSESHAIPSVIQCALYLSQPR